MRLAAGSGRVAAAAVVACALLTAAPPVTAKDFQQVSGTYGFDWSYWDPAWPYSLVQRSKNVCAVEMGTRFVLAGDDLSGNLDVVIFISLKGPCGGDWSEPATIHGKGTFVGRLGTAEGTFDVTMVAKHEQGGVAHGSWIIQDAGGTLAGLHGILEFAGFVGWGGTYRGELHFAP
jgi:hypothetical protein